MAEKSRLETATHCAKILTAIAALVACFYSISFGVQSISEAKEARKSQWKPHLGFALHGSGTAKTIQFAKYDLFSKNDELGLVRNYGMGAALKITIGWKIDLLGSPESSTTDPIHLHPRNLMPNESAIVSGLPRIVWDRFGEEFSVPVQMVIAYEDALGASYRVSEDFVIKNSPCNETSCDSNVMICPRKAEAKRSVSSGPLE